MRRVLLLLEQLGRNHYVESRSTAVRSLARQPTLANGMAHASDSHRLSQLRAEPRHKTAQAGASQHKANVPPPESLGNVRDPLNQEVVVTNIGMRIKRDRSKEHHHGLLQLVANIDSKVECGIVGRALRALHPVNHARSIRIGSPPRRTVARGLSGNLSRGFSY